MIGRPEIQRLARAGGVDERTQERDYVLTWLLAGMAVQDMGLVFKGGQTAGTRFPPTHLPRSGPRRCAKGLDPAHLGARLDARKKTLARNWDDRLRDQVVEVPAFEATWRQIRRVLRQAGYLAD